MLGDREHNDVATPDWLYNALDAIHKFDHDPCPLHYTTDGLKSEWGKSNYVNPPYDSIRAWLEKALVELEYNRNKSVFLVPFRPSRKYWFDLIYPKASQILLLEGGIKFGGYSQNAPMPLAVVVFDPAHTPRLVATYTVYYDESLKRRVVNLSA